MSKPTKCRQLKLTVKPLVLWFHALNAIISADSSRHCVFAVKLRSTNLISDREPHLNGNPIFT